MGPQFRDPGIHAPHARDRRGVPARVPVRGRLPARGHRAGARRRHRRGARRALSVPAGRAAGQPARGRHDVELVTRRRRARRR